jgi:DNA-binding NarL/FixJ family response regulator
LLKRILIVDDNSTVRRALCLLFTNESDFEVCGQAENGRDAIEKAQELHPDLVVTDLSMPNMNGLEETRVLNQLMPEMPVLVYTAYSDLFVEKALRAAGASAVIPKSAAIATLIAKARTLVDEGTDERRAV